MAQDNQPPDLNEASTGIKVPISFRLPLELASRLKSRAATEGASLNDIVVAALTDQGSWYEVPKPVAELLEADRKAFGDDTRDYVRRLLQYRYDELVRDAQGLGQKPRGPGSGR
jgi:hypothetical protein